MKAKLYSRDILIILAATFFYLCSPMLINPLITGFTEQLGESAVVAGLVAGTMNLTALVLRPLGGWLTDNLPKKRLATFGGVGLLIASLGYALTTTGWLLFIIRIINGIGYVLCTVCMATWMASLLPREKIGSGMGIYGLMNAVGMALAPSLGIFLYQRWGYRAAFITAVCFAIIMIILVRLVKDPGRPAPRPKTVRNDHHFQLVEPTVLPIAAILMLFALPYFATQAYIVSYVVDRHLAVVVTLFFPLVALFLIILRLSLRTLFDTVPFGRFLWFSLGSTLIGLLALSTLTNNWLMVVAAVGIAGGYGLMFSICQAKALLLVPVNKQGLANSTFYIGLDLGMALGPMVGGLIRSLFPLKWFYPVMLVTLPLIIVVYLLNRRVLEPDRA